MAPSEGPGAEERPGLSRSSLGFSASLGSSAESRWKEAPRRLLQQPGREMNVLASLSDGWRSDEKWSDAGCSLKTDATGGAYRLDVSVRERAKSRMSEEVLVWQLGRGCLSYPLL